MDKRAIENFKAQQTRRATRMALREARTATFVPPRVPQVRELTPNERDRLMHRRIERDSAQHVATLKWLASRKKKLPLPVFACENDEIADCGEAEGAETRDAWAASR